MRAITSFALKCALVTALVLLLSISAGGSLAQDVTPEPTATETPTLPPTDAPAETPAATEVPTEVPTEIATEVPTEVPTEAPTETVTEAPTDVPTEIATELPPAPATLFTEDWQDNETTGWQLTPGWTLVDESGSIVLSAAAPNESAVLTAVNWPYFSLSLRVRVAAGGQFQVGMAANGQQYQIVVNSDGAASLLRDGVLLGQAEGAVVTPETPAEPVWRTVQILAPGYLVAVKVDEFTPISYSDTTLSGMGSLIFSTSTDTNAAVAFDDLLVDQLDAPPPPPVETVVPLPTAVEATPEVTVEATAESTPEAVAEILALDDATRAKLPAAVQAVLDAFLSGDAAAVDAAAQANRLTFDAQGRTPVTLWATDDAAAATIASQIQAAGDVINEVFSVRVNALVTVPTLLSLATMPEVGLIEVPTQAVSTSNQGAPTPPGYGTGNAISEAVDVLGVAAWQGASTPVKGAGVSIAVIDTGFGNTFPISTAGASEYACLGSGSLASGTSLPGDTTHGLSVVQVLCDVAPQSQVFMNRATNATELAAAINSASTAGRKVILITMDLGASVSPGDGTGGGAVYGIDSVYTAITNARNTGKIVIVSAGNTNGRYVTLNWTGGSTIAANVPMTVFNGDTIHVSWNDWNDNLNGTNKEDFTIVLSGAGIPGSPVTVKTAVANRVGPPRATQAIASGCPTPTGCSATLALSNFQGNNGAVAVQVQITGQGTINTAGITPAIAASSAGNIARPADSPDAFAVGAICINNFDSFPKEATSAIGPVFGSGGAVQSLTAPFTRDQVKPDIVGPSHVNINNDPSFSGFDCSDGFGFSGTSAAASHIAGLAALLVSNTNASMNAYDSSNPAAVQGIEDYLQTHALDLPFFNNPGDSSPVNPSTILSDSFDMVYGAGFATLGSPTYTLSNTTNPLTAVDTLSGVCSGGIVYAGQANPGGLQQGTLANPYVSPAYALRQAAANQCVVLLPGEYTGPLNIPTGVNANGLYSYEAGTSFSTAASILFMTNNFNSNGGLFIEKNNLVVNGLTVQSGVTLELKANRNFPKPLTTLGAGGFSIINNTFTGFRLPAVIESAASGTVKGNTFTGFIIPSKDVPGQGLQPVSDTAVLDIRNSGSTSPFSLEGNIFTGASVTTSILETATWQAAIVGIKNSEINVYYNQFSGNTSGSIIGVNQWVNNPVASPLPSDKNQEEVRIFGNLFGGSGAGFNNTVVGPLIHVFQAPKLRFVNNSVIKNSMSATDNNFDTYFLYGYPTITTGAQLSDRRIEMHNNLFYGNGSVFGGLLNNLTNPPSGIGCLNFSGGASVARNNWFNPSIAGGECVGVGNITGSITETIGVTAGVTEANVFFGSSTDPLHPWRLKPGTCDTPCVGTTYQGGINTGDMTALSDMFGAGPYPTLFDLRNIGRVSPGGHANTTYNNLLAVDVGAYELEPPQAPIAVDITSTISEDSSTSLTFNLTATGGYIQSFALGTPLPTNYDTNVNNVCGGQPVRFTAPNVITYCPPANFNTQSPSNSPIVIPFTVTDTLFYPGQPDSGTITLNITKVNDGTPVAATFNVLTDYNVPVTYQLEPRSTLNNFSLTGTGTNVDYPFTFAFGAQTADSGQNNDLLKACTSCPSTASVLATAFTTANSNGGLLNITPVPGQQGFFKFTYTVTDGDGDVGTGTGTIVVLPSLAQDGTYDDASFNVVYNGAGWTPSYNATAYNTTLHASVVGGGSGDNIEFPFSGGQVSLNLRGSPAGNTGTNTLNLQFKLDLGSGGATFVDYNTARVAVPTLTCTNGLNSNAAPDASSNISNFSTTSAAYTVICKGFTLGQAHAIKVTNNLNGAAFTLDSIQVAKGYLNVGVYEETNANFTYGGTWINFVGVGPKGGSMKYSNGLNASVTFTIGTDVERMIIYRTVATGYGPLDIYVDNVKIATAPNAAGLAWAQPYPITLGPSVTNRVIELRNASTSYTGFEGLDLLGPVQPLGVGSYEETNGSLSYTGSWLNYVGAGPKGGSMKYTNSAGANVKFNISSAVAKITIYRTFASGYGEMEVYIDNVLQATAPVGTGLTWSLPFTVTVPTLGTHTVEIRNKTAAYTGFEGFDLLGPAARLTVGTYEETNSNLSYTGVWTDYVAAGPKGGSMKYTSAGGANVKFDIDSAVTRILIYRTFATGYGQMEVYIDNVLQATAPAGTGLTWASTYIVTVASPGNHSVEIRNKTAGQYTGFEGFDLLGAALRLGAGSYQETNANLTYSGAWTDFVGAGPKGGSMKYTSAAGANVKFDIDATVSRILIYRTFASGYGQMEVYIDNVLIDTAPAGTGLTWGVSFIVNVASPGNHTVEVRNKTAGQFTGFEAFDLLGPLARLGVGNYEETNPNLTYTGVWTDLIGAGPKGGSMKYANAAGANVKFDIDATVTRIIIYRTFAAGYGQTEVYIDNVLIDTAAAGTGLSWGQAFLVNVASPGNHTVEVRNKTAGQYTGFEAFDLLGPLARLGVGNYEETNGNLTYTGAWTSFVGTGPKGGSSRYSSGAGDNVKFDIDGTVSRIVIYRTFAAGYGQMEVYIDNVLIDTAPAGTGLTWGQPFLVTVASPGNHTVEVRNKTAGQNTGFEAFDLLGPLARLGAGIYEETDPNLIYTGSWINFVGAGPKGGSMKYGNTAGDNVKFDIDGTVSRIVIYRTFASGYGQTEVYIDNVLIDTAPAGTGLTWSQPFLVTVASPGNHTVEVRNKTAGQYTGFEAFDLLGPLARLGVGNYEETELNLTYTGAWTNYVAVGPKGGSMKYTTTAGSNVKFDINGTVSRIVIYRTFATGYGQMEVLIDNVLIDTAPAGTGLTWGQPFLVTVASPGNHTVEVRNKTAGQYTGFEGFDLLGPVVPIGPGLYQENYADFAYSGAWTSYSGPEPVGGSIRYSFAPGASMSFQFNGDALAIYSVVVPGGGKLSVTIDSVSKPDIVSAGPVLRWQQLFLYKGLTSGVHTVVITNTSANTTQPVYIDAVQVYNGTAPLVPGYTQDVDPNLVLTGTWTVDPVGGPSAGATTLTSTNGDQMLFQFTGTGFGIFTYNPANGAPMEVCYKLSTESDASYICATPATNASPAQATVGYTIYGLKSDTYTVRVRHAGTSVTQTLYIDGVGVLGTPATTLGAGTYENTNTAIVYTPGSLWTVFASASHSGGSTTGTTIKGATAQIRFSGNSLVLYQAVSSTGSNNASLCVVVPGVTVNAPNQCATFSQNAATAAFNSPVAFYGFGSGTHDVVIENRQHGGQLNIDRITVN